MNDHYPTCDAGPCINCGWPALDCVHGKCCEDCHHTSGTPGGVKRWPVIGRNDADRLEAMDAVKASDYDALVAEIAAVKHVGRRIEDKLKASMYRVKDLEAELADVRHDLERAMCREVVLLNAPLNDSAADARVKALETLCRDARYFVKNFACTHQEHEVLRSNWLAQFPQETP